MGYIITIKPNTYEDLSLMENFLTRNFSSWNFISGERRECGMTFDLAGRKEIESDNHIQFSYKSWVGNSERSYLYSLCHWICTKLGLDHMWYDGYRQMSLEQCLNETQIFDEEEDDKETIEIELKRLDELWESSRAK